MRRSASQARRRSIAAPTSVRSSIDADLRALSQRFDCVRTYSQGQGLDAVPEIAERYGMKVLMGIWLGRDLASNEREVETGHRHREARTPVCCAA